MKTPDDRTRREQELEDIVTEFILRQEEGEDPTIEEYITRYPRYAEALAVLLSDQSGPPRWPTGRDEDSTFSMDAAEPRSLQSLGPYTILERVGAGGGGTVYRARHEEEGHVVALKVLDRFAASDPRDLERFEREARMLRSMDLVNVLPVLAVGEDDGRHWIAMKWIEGSTFGKLTDAISSGEQDPRVDRLRPMEERARLVARIARAFEAVHGYGILHRDIKPTNILIDRLGEPMIIDFGIARAPELGELTMTSDGPLGTPRYIAPELLRGSNADVTVATDIYGLGLCLYELATGTRAFVQQTRSDLFTQICTTGPLEPRRASAHVPRDLSAIILRATDVTPRLRYPSMAALADDLERFARGDSPSPSTLRLAAPWRRFLARRWRTVAAAALLLAVVVPMVVWLVNRSVRAAEIDELRELVEPWFLAPPELAPRDDQRLLDAARRLGAHDVGPELRLRAAWIPFVSGRWEDAAATLGPASDDDSDAARLLRAWLDYRVEWGLRGRTSTVSQNTQLENPGVPMDTEDVRGELQDWSQQAELIRLRLRVPVPQAVAEVFKQFPAEPGAADATLLQMRAVLRFMSVPNSFVDTARSVAVLRPVLLDLKAASDRDDTSPWCRFLLAAVYVQYDRRDDARPLLESLQQSMPDVPEVSYLLALCHASGTGSSDEASGLFEAAAAGMRSRATARVPGDTALADQAERKVYAHWALYESGQGRTEAAKRVIARWNERFTGAASARWRDGSHWHDAVMTPLVEARVLADADEYDEALARLKAARQVLPGLVLPILEEARFQEVVMDDARAARALRHAARDQQVYPRQGPRSLEQWLRAGWCGLRPYAQEILQTTVVRPPPKD